MRRLETTTAFKRDFKRTKATPKHRNLDGLLVPLLNLLVADVPLPPKYRDHSLSGEWKDHRDCHVRPDLVLIYLKPDDQVLRLVRLGSHSELGL